MIATGRLLWAKGRRAGGTRVTGAFEPPSAVELREEWCSFRLYRPFRAEYLAEVRGTGPKREWAVSVTREVQEGNVATENSAADCRIFVHSSFCPAPVFAEKGITLAVGYASVKPLSASRS